MEKPPQLDNDNYLKVYDLFELSGRGARTREDRIKNEKPYGDWEYQNPSISFYQDVLLRRTYYHIFEKTQLNENEYDKLPVIFKTGTYYEKKKEQRGYTHIDFPPEFHNIYKRLQSPEIMWTAWFVSGRPKPPPPRKGGKTNKRRKQKKKSKRRRTLKY